MTRINIQSALPSLARHFDRSPGRRSGSKTLTWAVASLGLMATAVAFAWYAGNELRTSQSTFARETARAEEARNMEAAAAAAQQALQGTQKFMRDASAAGLAAGSWDERKFNLKQVPMRREAVNSLMAEIAVTPNQVFSADRFDIAVKSPDESLFAEPGKADSELVVSLKGTLRFRVDGVAK